MPPKKSQAQPLHGNSTFEQSIWQKSNFPIFRVEIFVKKLLYQNFSQIFRHKIPKKKRFLALKK